MSTLGASVRLVRFDKVGSFGKLLLGTFGASVGLGKLGNFDQIDSFGSFGELLLGKFGTVVSFGKLLFSVLRFV